MSSKKFTQRKSSRSKDTSQKTMRKVKREDLPKDSSDRMEKQDMITFIKDNLNIMDVYYLRDIQQRLIRDKFQKETGYFLTHEGGEFKISALNLKISDKASYHEVFNTFGKVVSDSPYSPKELKEIYFFKELIDWYYLKTTDRKDTFILPPNRGQEYLFELLYYVMVTDSTKIAKDLSISHEIMKSNDIKSDTYPKNLPIEGLEPLLYTRFKNGKVKLDGISEKQLDEVHRIVKMLEDTRTERLRF